MVAIEDRRRRVQQWACYQLWNLWAICPGLLEGLESTLDLVHTGLVESFALV